MLYSDYEYSEYGDSDLASKANAYNVGRILRKRRGPEGGDWFILGQYIMDSGMFSEMDVAGLVWQAREYEGSPPFGDQEAMEAWDKAQSAREALRRTAKKILKEDMQARRS